MKSLVFGWEKSNRMGRTIFDNNTYEKDKCDAALKTSNAILGYININIM